MGEQTGIEWTDHTFNPWWGCTRVSPGCEHCYAETFAARFGVRWGVKAERRPASEKIWNDPFRWNRAAAKAGVRRKAFCASMADVFDERGDDTLRERLWALIAATPNLDWQLLTKRIDHVRMMVPRSWLDGAWPRNAWIGTTVEDQRRAELRIPYLLKLPAPVRFLSCEPLLGPVDLSYWMHRPCGWSGCGTCGHRPADLAFVDWVICGGESGHGARPMHPDWARSLRDQCAAAGVPFFFKQWGEYEAHDDCPEGEVMRGVHGVRIMRASGAMIGGGEGDKGMMPEVLPDDAAWMLRVGKKASGSLLDGREHKAFPEAR